MTGRRIALFGVLAILAFDTVASIASRYFGFPYTRAVVGSFIIYAAVGFSAGRVVPVATAAGITALVGFAEATAGWWLSWQIGPGRIPSGALSASGTMGVVVAVALWAALVGAATGAIGHAFRAAAAG